MATKSQEDERPSNNGAFLSSMSFANMQRDCDCDECGPSTVPPTIEEAVRQHLRKRKAEELSLFDGSKPMKIAQHRELVKSENGFSLWKLVLPMFEKSGDPLVEYRNNHRILFVEYVPKGSMVFSIGKGIIGSAAEENSRKRVDWSTGSSYFLPSIKGAACGWVHKKNDDLKGDSKDATSSLEGGSPAEQNEDDESRKNDVIAHVLKVSPETLELMEGGFPTGVSAWVEESYQLFSKCVAKYSGLGKEGKNELGSIVRDPIELGSEELSCLEDILKS